MLKLLTKLSLCVSLTAVLLFASEANRENLASKNLTTNKTLANDKNGSNFNVVHEFFKKAYEKEPNFSVSSIKTTKILELKNGFKAHFITLNLNFKPLKKTIEKNDIFFVKDDIFVVDIINLKTKTSMRDELLGEKIGITYERLNDENSQNCN